MAQDLAQKYAEMIENDSDWVELFSVEIFKMEGGIDPLNIIAYEVSANFVVSADLNISIGCDFWYENAKRYNYNLQLFSGTATSDTIDLKEERYELRFYVMGTIGLRAGVNLDMKIGIFDTQLDSIGLSAEVGVYTRLYGYFYYHLAYTASKGRTSEYAGALFFELGIYLEIGFEAQALSGTISYNPSLYEQEWPLWTAGMQENVLDFAYTGSPELSMKRKIHEFPVPDSYFGMKYLDLKTGFSGMKAYDDATQFKIEITNPAFSYNPTNNILSVTPGSERTQDGQMIVTWISAPLAFTSAPITRRMNLHWDDYSNEYSICFNTYGGSVVPIITASPGGPVAPSAAPTRQGYDFAGWFLDPHLTQPYTFPAVMPNFDTMVYVKWTASYNTPYTVEHYKQGLNGAYTLAETENLTGVTGGTVTPEPKIYEGFNTPTEQRLLICPDGSSVVRYYYTRAEYTVTFSLGAAGGDSTEIKLKYGAAITAPLFNSKGYVFTGWDRGLAETMPAENLSYTALWEPASDTTYRVEHYVEQLSGTFALMKTDNLNAQTGSTLNAMNLLDTGLLVANGIAFLKITVNGETVPSTKVSADGKLVVKVYYKRLSNTLTFKLQNEQADIVSEVRYGDSVSAPTAPSRAGYNFAGWDLDMVFTMPAGSLTYTAQWTERNDTPYKVNHYQQNAGDNSYTLYETENLTGTTDTAAVATARSYLNFSINDQAAGYKATGKIIGDGSEVLSLYYDRAVFTVTFDKNSEQAVLNGAAEAVYRFGASVNTPIPTRPGYTFEGWNVAGGNVFDGIMPAADTIIYARWTAKEVGYTVEHYMMGVDGNYPNPYTVSDSKSGTADNVLTLDSLKKPSLEIANGIVYHHAMVGGNTVTEHLILPDGTLVVKLYYERKQHALNWNLGSGTATNDYTNGLTYYGAHITAPVLIRTGYSYTWDSSPVATMPANALTYTAMWTTGGYTVKFNANGGSGTMADQAFAYDAAKALSANTFVRPGYIFIKWNTMKNGDGINYADGQSVSNLTSDGGTVNLYAQWQIAGEYSITYYLNGGVNAAGNPPKYTSGSTITLSNPTRTGFTFVGWYTDSGFSNPAGTPAIAAGSTGNRSFYAKWRTPDNTPYSVHFNANGGSGEMSDQTFNGSGDPQVLDGNTFTPPNGYSFAGWATSPSGEKLYNNEQLVASPDYNLYAKWLPVTYSITYVLNGGSSAGNNPTNYTIESDTIYFTEPEPLARGFIGWYEDAGLTSEVTSIPKGSFGDKTLYANWGEVVGVYFHSNGGGEAVNLGGFRVVSVYIRGKEMPLINNPFSPPEGYQFIGWATSPDGEKVYDDGQLVTNPELNLYAKWGEVVGVYFHSNGGGVAVGLGGLKVVSVYIRGMVMSLIKNPFYPPEGYYFIGWATSPDGEKAYDDGQLVTNPELNLYAKWAKISPSGFKVTNDGDNTFNIARTDGTLFSHQENTAVIPHGTNQVTVNDAENPVPTASGGWPLSALDRAEGALGAGVRIALIDTGISTKAIAPEHLTDGKNYIDPNAGTEDRHSHGTAVAGIIAGSDEKGIEGVAPAATLVPLVYYTSDGDGVIKGDSELLARIIRDAVDVYGCRVINISSGTTEDNGELKAAVAYAEERGALVVSSVGNDNNEYPDRLYYPAAYGTVLGAAALRQDGDVASFSQRNASVALCAPGDDLRVLRKGGTTTKAFGTSYAAAYVSGAAAVLLAKHPELTPSQARHILCASALDIGKPGYDIESGWGAVQIGASLKWAAAGRRFCDMTTDKW